ncbi:unnamed protein product [Phytophthora lilii]|uniref:Unnamed protein product n=1 Tax=Phytophthora lilii TaxID=2077276 RepID=A0A9W6XGS8_9STRA|nr:unnamed protein product [Phytophthora lilii]
MVLSASSGRSKNLPTSSSCLTKRVIGWFCPVVHVSRLKAVSEDDRQPTVELVDGLSEDERFDFDEELLPEDSWEPEAGDDKYIVEAILDDRWPISTSTKR